MAKMKSYFPFAIVAILAGVIGWSASGLGMNSALGVNKNSEAVAPQVGAAAVTNQLVPTAIQPEAIASEPLQPVAPAIVAAPEPVRRVTSSKRNGVDQPLLRRRTQAVRPETVRNDENETASSSRLPVRERKSESGMSNTTKAVIAIGGGAATGALIGGLAGGKKGAAIGALAGGGGGAIYSLIRKKQGKEVW
jgi:hypothetical protein